MFDSIINEAQEKFDLKEKAGSLLASLLGLIANPENGGFAGFIERFKDAGLGDLAESWITTGDNTPISNEQLESALGEDTIAAVAEESAINQSAAAPALAFLTPHVIDALTPNGEIPSGETLISKISGFLSDKGGAVGAAILGELGIAGAAAVSAADEMPDDAKPFAAEETPINSDEAAAETPDEDQKAFVPTVENIDGEDNSDGDLKWLLPLLLLGLLSVLGYWFLSAKSMPVKTQPTGVSPKKAPANTASNTASNTVSNTAPKPIEVKNLDPRFSLVAKDGKYAVSGVVPDQRTIDEIKAKLTAELGEGIDFSGLKFDKRAKDFGANWWENFQKLLPDLKGWKTGTLSFAGNAITEVSNLPQAALGSIKSLFATGWQLPPSVVGDDAAAKSANEEAEKKLADAKTIEEVLEALNLSKINFDKGSADIKPDYNTLLDEAAKVLSAQPEDTLIEIGGHTDNSGNAAQNLTLSQNRAEAVRKALIARGVKESMLTAKGYGSTVEKVPNTSPDNMAQNRRIEYRRSAGK